MDGKEEILVRGGAKNVGDGPELQRPKGGITQHPGEEHLKADDEGDHVLGQWLGTAQLGDLGMRVLVGCAASM